MDMKYEHIKNEYPKFISINQLYKICHISKRSATYLLKHGIIPYQDTGKVTWKYRIAIDDVVAYLVKRDQSGSGIPRGAVTNPKKYKRKRIQKPITFFSELKDTENDAYLVRRYFDEIFANTPDTLTPESAGALVGFSENTIRRKIKSGSLKSIFYGSRYIIPKTYFMEFLLSREFLTMYSPSDTFITLLNTFTEWKRDKQVPIS